MFMRASALRFGRAHMFIRSVAADIAVAAAISVVAAISVDAASSFNPTGSAILFCHGLRT